MNRNLDGSLNAVPSTSGWKLVAPEPTWDLSKGLRERLVVHSMPLLTQVVRAK